MTTEQKKGSDIFQPWFEAQKNWMKLWADTFSGPSKAPEGAEEAKQWTSGWGTPVDMYNQWLNMSQKMLREYGGTAPWGIGQQTFERTLSGAQIYNKLYEFWASAAKLFTGAQSEAKGVPQTYQEFYEAWLRSYNELLKKFFTVSLFAPPGTPPAATAELTQMYANNLSKFFEPWWEAMQGLPGKMTEALTKGPQGYADLNRIWRQAYDETWGKVLRMPPLGLTREVIERLQRQSETLIDYSSVMTDFASALYRVGNEAMQKVAARVGEMYSKGQAPKTFKEFYTIWWTTNEETVNELFKSKEFSSLLGRVVDATMSHRKRLNDIMEEYLKTLPVPTRSEMNDLYKTLYQLKKEVRKSTRQVKELEGKLQTLETASGKEA